jgi:hypothetical protein
MSQQEPLEIEVIDWDRVSRKFAVEGINPKLDDIRKSGKRIPLLVLKNRNKGEDMAALRNVVLWKSKSSSDSHYTFTTYEYQDGVMTDIM